MSSATLGRYLRAFLVKLSMIESQLGTLEPQGGLFPHCKNNLCQRVTDEASFAILLELRDDKDVPLGRQDEENQDPPTWIPADKQLTTAATPDNAQLHLLRAVETGIINVSLVTHGCGDPFLDACLALPCCTRVRREIEEAERPEQEWRS